MTTKTKTNNTTTATIDFSPLAVAIVGAYNAEHTLANQLRAIYEATDAYMTVAVFRKQFIQWATAKANGGYSEDWAKHCLIQANIRLRAPRADAGKARKGGKAAATKVEKATRYIAGLDLSKRDLAKVIAALAEL